jgi:hypothetical protein
MTIPANMTCPRCSWINPDTRSNCLGCGQPLPGVSAHHDRHRGAARGPSSPSTHPKTITGIVSSAPKTVDMVVVQPFWFVVATVVALFGGQLLQLVVMPPVLFLFVLTLLVHLLSGHRRGTHLPTALIGYRTISNASRRSSRGRAPIVRRPGQQIRIRDAERSWTVRFLPADATDALMGDPVQVAGWHGSRGDFYAIRMTNLRTRTTRWSQQLVSGIIVAACIAVLALHFLP